MARLDQQLDVGIHKGDGHRHVGSIRQDEFRASAKLLDDAKDVIPSATVQAGTMISELKDDLCLYL